MLLDESEALKLVEVARMYYENNMTQSEIAAKLKVSRPLVSKMLSRARETGIVNIEIKSPYSTNSILLGQLKNLFNLKGGIIVPESTTEYLTEQLMQSHTINFLYDILDEVKCLGLGWGYTIGNLIEKIQASENPNNFSGRVCPLIGEMPVPNRGFHPNELVRIFAEKTGFKPNYLYAPAFPLTEEEKGLFMNTDMYKEIDKLWSEVDTAILSIGVYPSVPDQATASRFGHKLAEKKAVGSILSYYYNKSGEIITGDNDFAIRIPLEKITNIKRVIGICDNNSVKSIIGALKTGFLTHIITDEKTAAEIIKYKS